MARIALFGAGRIGSLHAYNVCQHPGTTLTHVFDPRQEAAELLAAKTGAQVAGAVQEILEDASVDAVMIASGTDTHAHLLEAAVQAGKTVFCEKPIDLDLTRAEACVRCVEETGAKVLMGFNRRYDPGFRAVRDALRSGEKGKLEMLLITSRDPEPPPVEYVRVSGGIFRDMTIHDFDMACWLMEETPSEVVAVGSCLVDPGIEAEGDLDTVLVTLKTPSGKLCQINNTRRAVYGYDQRLEVHASEGLLQSACIAPQTEVPDHYPFFVQRYWDAFAEQMRHFVDVVEGRVEPEVTVRDGLRALQLAAQAEQSIQAGRGVACS